MVRMFTVTGDHCCIVFMAVALLCRSPTLEHIFYHHIAPSVIRFREDASRYVCFHDYAMDAIS